MIASGGNRDGTVKIWNVGTGTEPAALTGHDGEMFSLCFNPSGTRLASAGRDGVIRLWDTESHELVTELTGHSSYVHAIAFSPDGTHLLSASGDTTSRIWDSLPRSAMRRTASLRYAFTGKRNSLRERAIVREGQRAYR